MINIKPAIKATYALTSLLITYAVLGSLFVRSPLLTGVPAYIHAGIVLSVIGVLAVICKRLKNKNDTIILVALLCISFALRVAWMLCMKPEPVSDFEFYYLFAQQISRGDLQPYDKTCLIFPHRYGLPLVLGLFYRIFGSSLYVGMIFNIFCSVVVAIPIYYMGKHCLGRYPALVAVLLYSFWPSQAMYSPVISTEQLFTLLFAMSVFLFMFSIKKNNIYTSVLSGILLAVSQFIRPIAPVLLIVLVLVYLIEFYDKGLTRNGHLALLPIAGFLVAMLVLKSVFFSATGIRYKTSSGYNFLVGTNYSASGVYNNEDAQIPAKYDHEFDKVHGEAFKMALNRIMESPYKFLKLIEKKYFIIWGDDSYGAYWSMTNQSNPAASNEFMKKISIIVSQSYYMALLLLALAGTVYYKKNLSRFIIFVPLVFLTHVLAYSFLEVQSRYHYPAITVLVLLSANGLAEITGRVNRENAKKFLKLLTGEVDYERESQGIPRNGEKGRTDKAGVL